MYIKKLIKMNLHQFLKSSGSFIFDWDSFETKLDAVISFLLRWGWLEEIIYDIFFWCQTCTKVHAQTQQKEKETFLFFLFFPFFLFPFSVFLFFFFVFFFPIILEIINYTLSNNPSIIRLYNKIYTYIYTTFGFDNSYNRDHYII